MQGRRLLIVTGLVCLAGVSTTAAYAIRFRSAAHDHGLASPDRHAIRLPVTIAIASGLASLWAAVRR